MEGQKSEPLSDDTSRAISWIHIGDTHISRAGEQSEHDLGLIVDEINRVYAKGGIDFVYIPGDISDDGSVAGYAAVRKHLDRLQLPWVAVVGDHDVHEKSFDNFQQYIAKDLYSGFTFGHYRFLRLNAFSDPRPDSFHVNEEQLDWMEDELENCDVEKLSAVVLLHCYPSELKRDGERMAHLLHHYPVLIVDMGHTHYNEISNDGTVIYTATRSTGQIEEGPVGYSVTTIDANVVSWHFVRLGRPGLAAITYPADARLTTSLVSTQNGSNSTAVRAKIWSKHAIEDVRVCTAGREASLQHQSGAVWAGTIDLRPGIEDPDRIVLAVRDSSGARFESAVSLKGTAAAKSYDKIDQNNAIGEWIERDILGTQLGPNKNGRKW